MTFTIENILNSLAGVLKAKYDYPVYTSENQQGTTTPCFFIFLMPSTIEAEIDERFLRDIGIDIVFVQKRNIPDGNVEIHAVQEYLDENLELFQYTDGENDPVYIHTYERNASIEDEELHYQLHIRARVAVPRDTVYMQTEETNVRTKNGEENAGNT